MRLDFLFTNTAEDLEFLDTPVYIHVHVVTMHEYKTIMMVLIGSLQKNYSFPSMKCHSHQIFSSRACEFLHWENFC